MPHRLSVLLLPLLVMAFLVLSCSPKVYREVYPTLNDGRYDSEFPYRGCSEQLEEIAESVRMLSAIAYYRTYLFRPEERVELRQITEEFLRGRAKEAFFVNKSLSGTATVILAEGRRVALLTAAHIVGFPDTSVSFHLDTERHATTYLKSLAVKERQMNFVGMLPEGGELEILAMERGTDLAIVGKTFEVAPSIPIPVFRYPVGRAKELEWGSFVYLFGYPSGYRIVTKGIVSNPNRDRQGGFLIDAVFGGGFSGGIALAIRDGVPNFELVGMVKLVSARSSYTLTPWRDDPSAEYDPTVPYDGEIYVERKTEIEYGVTQAVPVESILEFLERHQTELSIRGYPIALPTRASSSTQP